MDYFKHYKNPKLTQQKFMSWCDSYDNITRNHIISIYLLCSTDNIDCCKKHITSDNIDFISMYNEKTWNFTEYIIITVADSLYNCNIALDISKVCTTTDNIGFITIINAMKLYRIFNKNIFIDMCN